MTELTNALLAQLQGAPLQQISQQLGIDNTQASSAIGAALPLLLGALGNNAAQPGGADALHSALQSHTGLDLGSVLGSALGGGGMGGQILGHIFGGQQNQANMALGQATGLGGDQSSMLMKILAPVVMSYLANHMFGGGQGQQTAALANNSPQALSQVLGQETQQIHQSGAGGLLSSVLDQDGDGQLGLGDLLKIGGSLLGGNR